MTEQEKAERFAKSAPKLNKQEIEELNDLFPAYIFRRSKTREVWTSCCGRHETMGDTDKEWEILTAPHQREPQHYYDVRPVPLNHCPYCGKPVIVKELGRTGRRDNLCTWKRALVLRWYRGNLWGSAYDCQKKYSAEWELTEKPQCHLLAVYSFRPGQAMAVTRYFYNYPFTGILYQDHPLMNGRWNIPRPFPQNSEYGIGYDVIGVEEIHKSQFRYCEVQQAIQHYMPTVQYLTACCFYPRKIEMLMKAGMLDVVRDLVQRGVKHAGVIKWESTDEKNVFGLNRQELKQFMATNRNIKILELHKKLQGSASIEQCNRWVEKQANVFMTADTAKKWNVPFDKALRYLESQVGCTTYGGTYSMESAQRWWSDYLTAAEALGYPLHREKVLMPSNLGSAHDEATRKHREQLNREEKKNQEEQKRLAAMEYQERKKLLDKKYNYSADGYLIRVPEGKTEIIEEGRMLQHCVAGYADRHIAGKVTILFMRKVRKPNVPWITIEMSGNRLVQIHGYRNEGVYTGQGRFAPDPRKVYRVFIDGWLEWLKKGSKRNKDGTPKLPQKKEKIA